MKKNAIFLKEDVTTQYPLGKFSKLIELSIDIVENFLLTLEEGFNYDSTIVASYSVKYTSGQFNTSSKVESLFMRNINDEEVMKKFLYSYYSAYNYLNSEEKKIFDATFVDHLSDAQIMIKYNSYYDKITLVRRSAIVRFCLKSGLSKFVDLV